MAKSWPHLAPKHRDFIARQKVFFVATAPLSAVQSVNVSPKGYDSLRIIDDKTVVFVDLGGSGVETLAHIRENGRIALMFCAFEGPANILRIHGRARVVAKDDENFADALKAFPQVSRARAVVKVAIDRVSDSCGWGAPIFEFRGERDQLRRYVEDEPIDEWWARRFRSNARSIDGFPGLAASSARTTQRAVADSERLERVTLENDFVRLEPLEESHREPLRRAGEDPGLWRFSILNQHGADFDSWFDNRLQVGPRAGDLSFAVYNKKAGAWCGSSSYLAVALPHKRLEIGWTWYAKPFWSGATNPACKHLLMTHGFEILGLNRIELKLDATNARSRTAVERLGAKFEGVHRMHMEMPDGRIRDTAYFSVIKSEWPSVRAGLGSRLAAFASEEKRASKGAAQIT
jgi:RimJ/RimL family protein N-acetyltransferase/predicted pyridoxine 5'-phosphate oxidase superfamily flavin-nucleotide-binding protein